MNGSKSELLAIGAVTASYQGCNAMRLVGNGTMEFVWQGLCSIAGGYVRRAYNSAQWDEVSCAFVPAAMRRPRACSSRRSGLVTALCAAVGIAFLLPPPPAFAQSTTLVSNLDRLSTLKPAAGIYAQGFRTGAHTAGYTIRNVQVRLAAGSVTSSTKTSVLIRQERNGEPGALVTALTTQMPLVDGVNTFAAPANTTLNPQTNYFITVNEATPTRTCYERPPTQISAQTIFCVYEGTPVDQRAVYVRAVYEFTGRREQSGADGWSIDDKRLYKNYLGQDWDTSDRIFLFISVNGDVHTPNIEQQVEIVPPTVDGTPSVSGAGTDAQWSVGETVGVTVTFSEAVDVDTSGGTPSIGIGLGGTAARSATYASGTGTTELVFEYTLVSGDGSHGYMAVTPDSLALNGGTIRSAGSEVDALIAHNGALTSGNSGRSTGPEVRFEGLPERHDGETAFTVALRFGGVPAGLTQATVEGALLEVTGGRVTAARQTAEGANPAWEVTVAPDGPGEVTLRLPVRACTEANAVCIGGRALAEAVEAAVPGVPLTASFTQAPAAHDGSNGFDLHMEFSHEPNSFSYRTVRDALFDVEGGRIGRVWRREPGKNRLWGITVVPDGPDAVTLAARATTECGVQHAVCDADGRKISGDLRLTVPGPQTLSAVSIAPAATPVSEGTAAAFTLSRTGATEAELTVAVSVSESEASVSGTAPTSVTFATDSASATLSVATDDDEVSEDASTVTATVSSGSGYTADGTSGSAEVVVNDDDAAPVVTTVSPIVVAENATAVATLAATDEDTAAENLSWSIPAGAAGGADGAKFALTAGGLLTFGSAKDFEAPDDADTDGEYEVTVRVTDGSNPVDAALVVRLADIEEESPSARFEGLPERHDGETAFTVALRFGGVPEGLTQATVEGALLEVTGGRVTAARQTAEGANPAWEVTVAPDGPGEVTLRLPVRACTEANAVCIGGRALAEAVEAAVPGVPLTASFTQAPAAHDGSNGFDLHMEFSHEPNSFSYRTVRDALFDVEGGRIGRVWRREPGKNRLWGFTVVPQGPDAVVTLAARATTECGVQHAVCDADGRKFSGDLRLTVPGPQTLSAVSIAPAATPVSEGTAAAFTLSRTGATEAALTVAVAVSETGAAVSGTTPTSVTFAAESSTATLRVATEDDEVAEDASTLTATVSSGTGYTVSGTSGSTEVVVNDDDAAPVVATASPIVVVENATAVATLAATDADTDAGDLSWSIPEGADGGADASKFALTAAGLLTFRAAKDYESPDDANTDGDYEVTVRVTDGSNLVDAALVVQLTDVDEVAPTLSSASVDGVALTLTFNEALDKDSVPSGSAFAVAVAGSVRTVASVSLLRSAVTLTLSSAVTSGETVTVGYIVPTVAGAKPMKDTAGNTAAAFADAEVTNAAAALPVVSIAASTTPVTEGTAAAFTLTRTGATEAELTVAVSVSESDAAVSGTPPASVTFAAGSASAVLSVATEDDEAVEDASTVTATVSSGTGYTVDGTSGSAAVVVNGDDAAPVVSTVSPIVVAENATAVATLAATDEDTAAEALSWSIPAGAAGGADGAKFALTAGGELTFGSAKDFEAPDDADTDGDYEVTVRVTDGANPVDAALVVRLEDADDVAPVLSSASVDGAVLTLTFGEALDTASQPASSSFAVSVAGSARTVDAVAVSGSAVTLTLSSAVASGETVTVGYTVPTGADAKPVQDAAGNRTASVADAEVTNETAPERPVVSIAAVSTPVTEGAAAAFVLRRTGAGTAELTVTVSVSEAGSVLDDAGPSSATFASGASEARLTVATANDAVDEADARVSASVVAGDGYEVDAENASAGVDVFDDDAAAQAAAVELWSTTMTWTDLGNNWFGGFADGFSNPGWSEDGQAFRIWYISYDAGARTLLMAHDGSGGLIGEPGELSLHVGGHEVGAGEALSAFAGARVGRVSGVDAQWSVGQEVTVRLTRASGDAEAAPAGPGFSVADAQANEASGVPLRFRVTLDAPAQSTVSVRYRTANGTAQAGADYVAGHGAVRFARGETAKTVDVAVLKDDHDEGSETMTLTLSGPYGATVADATATGTISNTGAIPKAWIARFGRTVAEQVIEAVQARFGAPREAGLSGTIAGQSISGSAGPEPEAGEAWGAGADARQGLEALSGWFGGEGGDEDGLGFGTRTLSGSEVLSTSSFALTEGTAQSGFAGFWGRGAVTRFDGRDGEMALDGEVASAMLGADFARDALLGGLMVSHSRGEGGYRSPDGNGEVESTLTALFPYARYALSERVSVWGMGGYGEGTLTVIPEGQAPLRPDMDFVMGALGVRGVLLDGGDAGPTLAAKSDAFAVRTSTDAVSGSGGHLEASQANVTRVRLALEGTRPFGLGGDAVLTPSLEVGVRHDGGDAETGFGADIGAGIALSDPARGLSAEVRARGLLTHEAQGMRERGLSGTLAFDPSPETERGLSLEVTQSVGAQGEGGVDALLERSTFGDLAAEEGDDLSARRLDARIGYGLGILDDRWTATPELGFGLSDRDRELRLGWRLAESVSTGLAFELGLEGTRRESSDSNASTGAEHGIGVGAGWRLVGPSRGGPAFEMRIDAARFAAGNDDQSSDDRIGFSVTARW